MFGFKRNNTQKITRQALITATVNAVDDWMSAPSGEDLIDKTGKSRQQLLDIVSADDEVESCREDLRSAMLAAPWRIWGDGSNEEEINRLYRIVREHLPVFVEVALVAKFTGYSVAEYIYQTEADGFLTLNKVLNKDGELDAYTPLRDGALRFAHPDGEMHLNTNVKHLLLTSKASPARPMGDPFIVRAYPAVCLRRQDLAYAGQFIKRYAQPYIVGKQGGFGIFKTFSAILYRFLDGGAAAIGKDDEIIMLQNTASGEAFEMLERLANARIQKLLLGRVKTGDLQSGSRAAQETEEETREDRISGYLSLLANAVQHAINGLIAVNQHYGNPISAPQGLWFEFEEKTQIDLKRAQRDKYYLDSGQLRLSKDYYTDILGFESEHIELLEASSPAPSAHPLKLAQTFTQASTSAPLSAEDEKERQFMQPKIESILKALDQASDYADFEAKLAGMDFDNSELVADLSVVSTKSYIDGASQ